MKLSFSIEEASEFLGIGRTKLYEAINKGKLRAKKYGKRTILLKDDLDDFLINLEDYRSQQSHK